MIFIQPRIKYVITMNVLTSLHQTRIQIHPTLPCFIVLKHKRKYKLYETVKIFYKKWRKAMYPTPHWQ